jgi:hypothetical protein
MNTNPPPKIAEKDVVVLHRPSGELTFRGDPDQYALDELVQYRGVGFVVKGVTGDSEQSIYRAYPPSLENLGDVEPFAIRLEPGDVVVIQSSGTLDSDAADRIRSIAEPAFPGHRIIVVDSTVTIGKIAATKDEPAP